MMIRPKVIKFAEVMENVLKANDHKGGWRSCHKSYLLKRLLEETAELAEILVYDSDGFDSNEVITKECVDIANFAMMIADISGGLKTESTDVLDEEERHL